MYDFVRGPLLWISFIVFTCGLVYRIVQLFLITRKKDDAKFSAGKLAMKNPVECAPDEFKTELVISFQNTLLGRHPVMAIITTVFHFCLFVVPLFLLAHSLAFNESWGFSFLSIPDSMSDLLTIVCILCTGFFLIRRMFVPKVKAVSSFYDYLLLFITAAPFLTGFFAYHQWFDYNTILTLHIFAGEIMFLAIPFTKLGHMVFFFFVRILIGSEYSFTSGTRTWVT